MANEIPGNEIPGTEIPGTEIPIIDQNASEALIAELTEHYVTHQAYPTDAQLLTRMVEHMGDPRGVVRLRFATMLGEYIGKPAVPALVAALEGHPNVVVRRAAAKTLTLVGDRTTIPNLLTALFHDSDTVVKGSAVGGLARMGEAAVPPLLDILAGSDHSETMKGHAAWALAFIGAAAKDYLTPALASDSPEVRGAVVGAIAKIVQDEAVGAESSEPVTESDKEQLRDLLVKALSDSNSDVRSEAAVALSNTGHTAAIPQFTQLLRHSDPETRKAAALALMKLGNAETIPALEASLPQETNAGVQAVLKLAITQIQRRLEAETDDW
jgi:bilin biosynthesis protein